MKKIIIFVAIIGISLFMFGVVHAEGAVVAKTVALENPLQTVDVSIIIGNIIKGGMGVVGSITLLVFVAGGFMWLTSAGNQEQIKKGSQTMLWATIGLFIIFSSYAILNLVLGGLGATGLGPAPKPQEVGVEGCYCLVEDSAGKVTEEKVLVPALSVREECEKSHSAPVAGTKVSDCGWNTSQ